MKLVKILIIALLLSALSACSLVTNGDSGSSNTVSSSGAWKLHSHQSLTSNAISRAELRANEGMTIDVLGVGLKSVVVRRKAEEHVTSFNQSPLYAYILSDYRYNQPATHDFYLAVETGSKVLFYDFESSSLDDILCFCDVDGDGLDEIIVQQTIDELGGAGQFSSHIFKVIDNKIQEIFYSSTANQFDTGFTSMFLNGRKLKITNSITGYHKIIDISKRYTSDFFDKNGKPVSKETIWCDSFHEFTPRDVDGDGVF